MKQFLLLFISLFVLWLAVKAVEYPGTPPGKAHVSVSDAHIQIGNAAISGEWKLGAGKIASLTLTNMHNGQSLTLESGHMPRIPKSSRNR